MINIDKFYRAVLDFLNKNNGQYISPDEFNRVVRLASLDYFKELIGGKLKNQNVYGRNRILDRRLNPFRKELSLTFVNGEVDKPVGMELVRNIAAIADGKRRRVRFVEEHRFEDSFDNPLAEGTLDDPICTETEKTIKIYPSFTSGVLRYLKTPSDPKWAYTLVNGRTPTYNPTASVDLEWGDTEEPQLMMRALNYLGMNVRDVAMIQFSEKEKQTN